MVRFSFVPMAVWASLASCVTQKGMADFVIPDDCIGMGGFCRADADCRGHGREGWCSSQESRCYQTCHPTATRSASDVPRVYTYCCDYGEEAPVAKQSEELPKHWGGPRFKGKRVLVTGGDSGIGFAAVQAFYLECAKVLLSGHSVNKSKAAFDAIKALPMPAACSDSPPSVAWVAADVSNATEAANLVDSAVQAFGGLDIAVNNAGTAGHATMQIGSQGFVDSEGKFYDESIMAVNFRGTLFCMNAQIAHWLAAGTKGSMVNIASIAGEVAWAGPLYSSSKWAMIGFTKQAALVNAPKGIRINAVAPGAVNTTMLRNGMSPTDPKWLEMAAKWSKVIPMGRIAEPWEMAGPITFLASDMAAYVTGQVLTADGDITEARPGSQGQASTIASSATPDEIFL